MNLKSIKRLWQELKESWEARQHYVGVQIRTGLPLQIRTMRQLRGWSQEDLAKRLGSSQNVVSRLENPKTSRPTSTTLIKLAEVFDVALVITFMPFDRYASFTTDPRGLSVAIPKFSDAPDPWWEKPKPAVTTSTSAGPGVEQTVVSKKVVNFGDFRGAGSATGRPSPAHAFASLTVEHELKASRS